MGKKTIKIDELMSQSGVKFGTSGARGLVTDMTDEVCYAYTLGFIQYLEQIGELGGSGAISVGGDLRSSTDRIMKAVAKAIEDRGYTIHCCGKVPSPALAYYGLVEGIPTAMVTGSHIPDDRNGIKYTKREGEILKTDEAGMKSQTVTIPDGLFDGNGALVNPGPPLEIDPRGTDLYIKRYLDFFPSTSLAGKRIGVFQHSAVGREIMITILSGLGAEVTPLGFSEAFIPVDTEAIRPEDIESARNWALEQGFDAIVSTDGDSDRPLVSDENGKWLRGDVAGILCAAFLGADTVVTPVSCNSAVEKSGLFRQVRRTRIGSPYVIEWMQNSEREGSSSVVGYEANGGFLLQTPVERDGRILAPLPTRDAIIVQLAILLSSIEKRRPISQLLADLPQRFTYSDRLKEFPTEKSKAKIAELYSGDFRQDKKAIEAVFADHFGKIKHLDATDGVRITFENEEVVHLRPSGNAPEFRCYTEADTEARAVAINNTCTEIMAGWR
jgi:phosphomannomutase